jgi:hypothetical protein
MIHALLLPLVLAGSMPPEPVDPATEVLIVEATFEPETICDPLARVVPLLGQLLGGDDILAAEIVIAYGVEIYEDGYGRNLTEEGETALEGLMWECLGV